MAQCTGCGLIVNPGSGLLEVNMRPNGGIECDHTNNQLFVTPQYIKDNQTAAPPTPTSGSFDGTNGKVIISGDPYNGLGPNGDSPLFARCPTSIIARGNMGYFGATFPVSLDAPNFNSVTNFGGAIVINNPTPWNLEGFLNWNVYGGTIEADAGYNGYAFLEIETYVVPGPVSTGFQLASPPTNFRMDNRSHSGIVHYEPSNLLESNFVGIPTGANLFCQIRFTIKSNNGHADWFDNLTAEHGGPPYFEFYGHFHQTDACA